MKTTFLLLFFSISFILATAQLVGKSACPPFNVDIMAGSVNELVAKSAIVEVMEKFPCSTGMIETDSHEKCAGVFYADKGINFYTGRQYIEISDKFKGKLTPALMGTNRTNLFNQLGHPKLKGEGWDAYQMGYGTLILYYSAANKINKIQMSSKGTDAIKLCE